jgi:enoyl-CoA hydratase
MDSDEIRSEQQGALGIITLTRPKALNALTLGMIRVMNPLLRRWEKDASIGAVLVRGEGDRAFCAGGDVRAVYDSGMAQRRGEGDGAITRDFFREEYILNRLIKRYSKPYVALIDGITMGGGVGLSVHGTYRVATERTMLAMPETGIGLFPDVGGSYFLPRIGGEKGVFLALSGTRVHAADLLHLKIATHHVPAEKLDDVVAAVAKVADQGEAAVGAAIAGLSTPTGEPTLPAQAAAIARCFAGHTVEAVLEALTKEGSDWSAGLLKTLAGMSPTSMKITLRQMREGAKLDFDACMQMEYRMTQGCMAGHDFFEGIRAQLVDKDRNPKWNPATLAEVTEAEVARHFAPLGANDLTFPN